MQSRILLNIAMLALVAVLGLFIYSSGQDGASPTPLPLEAKRVDTIEIQHRDRRVVLKKTDGQWRMTQPINIAANDFRINTLLKFINFSAHNSYDTATLDLARYKLDTPQTSIRFSHDNDNMLFQFGSVNPISQQRYVMTGSSMYLIEDNFYPLVSSQLGALISHKLLPDIDSVSRLQLPDMTFTKNENGSWQLTPSDTSISSDQINAIVYEWQHAQAFGVHDYMERDNLGTINISYHSNGNSHDTEFIVTDIEPWLIIARPELNIEYHFNPQFHDRLLRPGQQQDKTDVGAS